MSKELLQYEVNDEVAKAWSESVGRQIGFQLLEVEAADGRVQTQLISPETGSVVVAVNATGDEAVRRLVENAGATVLDDTFTQLEVAGPNQANQVNKSDASVPVPSDRPGAAVEAPKSADADKLEEDLGGSDEDEDEEEVLPEDNPNAKLTELNDRATELGVEGAGEFKKKADAVEAINAHKAAADEE